MEHPLYPTPGCTSAPRTVTVTVNQPTSIATQPVNRVVCTDKVATYSVVAARLWSVQLSVAGKPNTGNTWTNVANGGVCRCYISYTYHYSSSGEHERLLLPLRCNRRCSLRKRNFIPGYPDC